MKLAIIISHPIQHFCPQYASYSTLTGIQVKVFFASSLGRQAYFDSNFKHEVKWGNLRLEEFDHVFLNEGQILKPDKNLDAPDLDVGLADYNPDVLITYGYFQKYQRRAHRWAYEHNKILCYISDSELRQKRSWWKILLKWPFIYRYFSHIDYFMSVGNSNEKYYLEHGVPPNKIKRTCFPIDLELYKEAFQKRKLLRQEKKKELGIEKNDIVLSTVGKLVPWKSQVDVIQALHEIEKAGKEWSYVYVVAGTGPDMEALKIKAGKLKKNRVIFLGFVNPEDLPSIYAATDIYVHPARVEPHSLAISEAIYMACPVILSDRCGSYGINDDVSEGQNGMVYTWNDIGELSIRLKELGKDVEKRNAFSDRSHKKAVLFQGLSHGKAMIEIVAELKMKMS